MDNTDLPVASLPTSQCERSALRLVTDGRSAAEIALHLGLTPALADRLRSFPMQRLNLKTQAELAVLAGKKGLVGEHPDQ